MSIFLKYHYFDFKMDSVSTFSSVNMSRDGILSQLRYRLYILGYLTVSYWYLSLVFLIHFSELSSMTKVISLDYNGVTLLDTSFQRYRVGLREYRECHCCLLWYTFQEVSVSSVYNTIRMLSLHRPICIVSNSFRCLLNFSISN